MRDIRESLVDIVGERGVSDAPEELWFYSRDPGVLAPHRPDYVVAPKTTEEVQKIVRLANREKIPVVPMGNGMSLAGLVIPLKGGIRSGFSGSRDLADSAAFAPDRRRNTSWCFLRKSSNLP